MTCIIQANAKLQIYNRNENILMACELFISNITSLTKDTPKNQVLTVQDQRVAQ